MSESNADAAPLVADEKPVVVEEEQATEVGTPTKRTPKRKADALKKESEELLKTLGVSLDMEDGRRRTRSSARGGTPTTAPTTPPAKRARETATTPKQSEATKSPNSSTTPKKGGGAHGERKRLLVLMDPALPKEYTDNAKESTAENDAMDAATESNATASTTDVEETDAGKSQDATAPKVAEDKQQEENANETDLKDDKKESDKQEDVPADTKQDVKDTADVVKDSATPEPEQNAPAKENDKIVPTQAEEQPKTDGAAQNKECLEEAAKPAEPMEVDVPEKLDEVPSETAESKSEAATKEQEVVDAVCESNGSNTTATPEKAAEPEETAPVLAEKEVCLENDKQEEEATIKADLTAVEPAPAAEETPLGAKVEENNSTVEAEKETAPVNDVAETKSSEKVIPADDVENKVVTSEVTPTAIQPLPTPE